MFWARQVWFLRSNAKEKGLLPMMQVPANEGEHPRTFCHGLWQSGSRRTWRPRLPLSPHSTQSPLLLSIRHSCALARRLHPAAHRRVARHCSAAGAVAHLRRRPGFLCMRSYDHESKHPRLQDYPLKSNNETGRQIELDQGVRLAAAPPPPPPAPRPLNTHVPSRKPLQYVLACVHARACAGEPCQTLNQALETAAIEGLNVSFCGFFQSYYMLRCGVCL